MLEQGSSSQRFPESNLSACTDPLTGLFNRYYLNQVFPQTLEDAEKEDFKVCVFIIDVDDFKHVNDTYGHLAGDEVLKSVSEVFKKCVREDDVVIRYAGDEFIVLSKRLDSKLASVIGDRIVSGVNNNIIKSKDGQKIQVTISGGFAVYPHDGKTQEELIENADQALYLSKQRGKNRISALSEVAMGLVTKKEMLKIFPCRNFIDREVQFDKLKKIWQFSGESNTPVVFIKGEIGIGKSRILQEFDRYASKEDWFCLKVECGQKHTVQPYYVLSQALTRCLKENEVLSRAIYFLSPKEVEALSCIVPSLKEKIGVNASIFDKSIAEDSKELSVNLFKGLRSLFIELSRQNGFFLYFDNIQWLDKAAFELLNYFIEWESGRRLFICGSLCEDDLRKMELPCMEFLSASRKEVNFSVIEMTPFSLEETRNMVVGIFPDIDAKDDFFDSIHSLSKGNPLFIEELLKYLIESEKIFYKNNSWQMAELGGGDIPASLDDVMKRRIKGLDAETKEILVQAALIGEDFQLETLRRLVERNEGYLLELIDRAKQKVIIAETDTPKGFNFLNSYLQKVFYDELTPAQKSGLHNKLGDMFSEGYANNPSAAAGDVLYHYNKADNKSKLTEYSQVLSKHSLELFNPRQLSEYLEILSKEVASQPDANAEEAQIKQLDAEIDDEALAQIAELIKLIFAAVKNINLYPPLNRIREESGKRVYEQFMEMLKSAQNLTFSEVEKILLVNGRRIPLKEEKKTVVGDFIALMIELDIKALQILHAVNEKELIDFLNILAREPDETRSRGGILVLLKEKEISNIKINVADYGQLAMRNVKQAAKEKLVSMVLMDFLSGKTSSSSVDKNAVLRLLQSAPDEMAENIIKTAATAGSTGQKAKIIAENIGNLGAHILPGGWAAYKDDLAKLLKNLNADMRNEVVSFAQNSIDQRMNIIKEVVGNFSDEEIIEMITSGYSSDKMSLLNMRELMNKLVFDDQKKARVLDKLEHELRKMGIEESEISFITQKEYKAQSLEDRMQTLLNLPPALYSNVGIDDVKTLIKDLTSLPKKDNLSKLIAHFLAQLENALPESRSVLFDLIAFSLSLFSCDTDEFDALFAEIIETYARYVMEEKSRDNYDLLLKGVQISISWVIVSTKNMISVKRWIIRNRFSCLNRLLENLFKLTATEAESGESAQTKEIKSLAANFLQLPFVTELVNILINELADPSLEYIVIIEDMLARFGRPALRALIVSSMEEEKIFSPFEGYIYQRKIVNIFKKTGEPAVEEIIGYLNKEYDVRKLAVLIRFLGELKSDKIAEALKPFLIHKDYNVKEELVAALGKIGGVKSKNMLIQIKRDKDRRISVLAATELKKFK
ncbi:MAG: diguanylate cyclase [Candidatus Omnitrophica bacterium]|nr:diguanylate cyclase [Candidatus Omnitrophota bacterium]MBU4478900.1 diguanylate cyclase [Candidatus Omnitrophota bacterium]